MRCLSFRHSYSWCATPVALAAAMLMTGCTTVAPGMAPAAAAPASAQPVARTAPAGPAASASPASAAVAPAAAPSRPPAPAPGQAPAFAKVIEDARRIDGLLPLWQKDDKVWIELAEKDFDAPFFLSPKLASGIGEASLFGGLMGGRFGDFGGPQWIEFRRVYNQVQMIARNAEYVAAAGTPAARSVAAAYSPSLLASTPVASLPHPDRKTVLVEANALFLGDMLGVAMQLQRSYRQGYSYDARNSAITRVRGKADELVFEVQNHYAAATIAVAQPGAQPGTPQPSTPNTVPDVRSLFVKAQYSITRLPAQVMAQRPADARLGHFITAVTDFTDDLARSPRKRFVNRWRLEKKDPSAALSEPVRPITYWIDRDVPLAYREAITAGILEWNKAFERIGFSQAIVVKLQPEDADFDTLDTGVASVRWMTNARATFGAIGPSHVDPRSGEILDADIALESLSARAIRYYRAQVLPNGAPAAEWADLLQSADLRAPRLANRQHTEQCLQADLAAEQLGYALDLVSLRDGLDPDSPPARAFVQAYLKEVTMHEVGHTLGLRHNFRASRLLDERQLADPRTQALTGSVMEYSPINLGRDGEAQPTPFQATLGAYDYWAIEYAYRPLPPDQEAAELARIAARSGEPELAFGTDEDNYLGVDPETLQNDLGKDPVVFAAKRFDIAQQLIEHLEHRPLKADDSYAQLRRGLLFALRDVTRSAGVVARQIGGVRTLRDAPNTGRDPLLPVPAAQQRAALDLLARRVFSAEGLRVSPALQRRLVPDFLERGDQLSGSGDPVVPTDFSPTETVLDLQRALLAQLMSDGVAQRLLDGAGKADAAEPALALSELYSRLGQAVWSDLDARRGDIATARRALQRDHVSLLAALLVRPVALSRADARSQVRQQAEVLLARAQTARQRPGLSPEARAHLDDSVQALREALSAKLTRVSG